jgi:hypothetical protein
MKPSLGVRMLGYTLITLGLTEFLCVVVITMSTDPDLLPFLMLLAGFALGTTLSGAGLSAGSPYSITGLRILVGVALVGILMSAAVPHYAYGVSVPLALLGLPLYAANGYMERNRVRSPLSPQMAKDAGRSGASVRRATLTLGSIGGFGLFTWGLVVAILMSFACYEGLTSGDRWLWLGAVVGIVATGIYVMPCLAFGFVIWREPPSSLATLIGFGLATITADALNGLWLVALIPESIAIALAIGLFASVQASRPTLRPA